LLLYQVSGGTEQKIIFRFCHDFSLSAAVCFFRKAVLLRLSLSPIEVVRNRKQFSVSAHIYFLFSANGMKVQNISAVSDGMVQNVLCLFLVIPFSF